MLMQMHGKKGLNGDGRLLRWFLVPLLPKPLVHIEVFFSRFISNFVIEFRLLLINSLQIMKAKV